MARGSFIAVTVLAAACAHVSAPPPFPTDQAHLHVRIEVPRTGPITVHVVVPETQLPRGARLEPFFSAIPEPAARQRIQPWPAAAVPDDGPLALTWQVEVPKDTDDPGYPVLIGSFDTPRARHLALGTLVPQLLITHLQSRIVSPVPAFIEVITDDAQVCSLPGSNGQYFTNDARALFDGVCLISPAIETVEGSAGLRIASADFDAATLTRLADLERRAAAVLAASHGPRGTLDLIVVHTAPTRRPKVYMAGLNRGPTISMFSNSVPDGRATGSGGNVLLHELVHSYQPPDAALPHWITEGFTEYFSHRVGLSLDGLPDAALYEGLERMWSAFLEVAPKGRASEDLLGDYFGGAVLAYCIDVRLRRDGSSLEKVLAATRRKSKGDVANAQWEQEIAFASAPAGALVLSARTDVLDPVELCFKQDSLVRSGSRSALADSYLSRALKISSIDIEPRQFDVTIRATLAGSSFRPGDSILSVDDERVVSVESLLERLWVVQRSAVGSAVFEVSRDGARERVTVPLPEPDRREQQVSQRKSWGRK